ncbi:MAG: glycoside hydrolase family 2 TIM barrel-domain containing protein, partial [Rhodothermales bacterium]
SRPAALLRPAALSRPAALLRPAALSRPAALMRSVALLVALCVLPPGSLSAQEFETSTLYLSGHDKDDTVEWEFMVTDGRRAGTWSSIPVPSNWELQGFGTYNYGHDDPKADEVGRYRHRFEIPASWRDRRVEIVFEGAMTDTDVRINGRPAGPTHQGGFYEFSYDVTDLIVAGAENLLEVDVAKMSSNASVNEAERQADFWVFGGIFRPVYLKAHPQEHIARLSVDARHGGDLRLDMRLDRGPQPTATSIRVRVLDTTGSQVAAFERDISLLQESVVLRHVVEGVEAWSPEYPNLYALQVELSDGDAVVHRATETIGFRTIEVRAEDGIYLNGTKIRLKGVNRHSFWPDAGRTTSREVSRMDAELLKDMNMNAVRTSHYPPDAHFLEMTDSLGLLVIDELTGWQDAYDTQVGARLVRELIARDHNRPSVILWANGNEGGWNRELDRLFTEYDMQGRTVIHPWETFGQINTVHYQAYDCCAGTLFHGREIFMPTELLHGLYDGGHGAGLEDFWNAMLYNRLAAGAFLWALADEGILRTDWGDTLDTDGNHAPDGIVGPYREKEASFFTIKEVWSPVSIDEPALTPSFDGRLVVENRYHFTDVSDVTFAWELVEFPGPADGATGHHVMEAGRMMGPDLAPGTQGYLELDLPASWYFHDALFLTATDPHGREIMRWTWMIRSPVDMASRWTAASTDSVIVAPLSSGVLLRSGGVEAEIDGATGLLRTLRRDGVDMPLADGPRLTSENGELSGLTTGARGRARYAEARFEGSMQHVTWTMLPGGWLELSYRYLEGGAHDQLGASFDFPEEEVESIRWLGQGPYRVWKNRMRGMHFDVWEKAYNDAVTGLRWQYPEFKGHHAHLYWAVLETHSGPLTVVSGTQDLFLRLFTPSDGVDPRHTAVTFPDGDLSFMNAIPPIGTKFHPADELGPQGAPNRALRWFDRRRVGQFDVVVYIRPGSPPSSR